VGSITRRHFQFNANNPAFDKQMNAMTLPNPGIARTETPLLNGLVD
jgi:hypothetical protein